MCRQISEIVLSTQQSSSAKVLPTFSFMKKVCCPLLMQLVDKSFLVLKLSFYLTSKLSCLHQSLAKFVQIMEDKGNPFESSPEVNTVVQVTIVVYSNFHG